MLQNVQFELEIFTSSPVAYITNDFKKLVSDRFRDGSISRLKLMYQEKNEAIRIVSKHNNSLETSPYPVQKNHVMHQSVFTFTNTQIKVYETTVNLFLRK